MLLTFVLKLIGHRVGVKREMMNLARILQGGSSGQSEMCGWRLERLAVEEVEAGGRR